MARNESDREDLFAEIRTFVPRWEIRDSNGGSSIIVGLRADGRMAIYFGSDPCYHFDSALQLLRGYVDGCLYRTQGTTLARLYRQRSQAQTELLRTDLAVPELQQFLQALMNRLERLHQQFVTGKYVILRAEGGSAELLETFMSRLAVLVSVGITLAPAYPTRRQ